MTTYFLTTTNIDLTEGRGTARPLSLHLSLENAVEDGRTAGVMGTSSDVAIYRVDDGIFADQVILSGSMRLLEQVAGAYLDGTESPRWGVLPSRVEKLNVVESRRLAELSEMFKDWGTDSIAPEPEQGVVVVYWANFPGSIALRRISVPQIIAILPRDYIDLAHIAEDIREKHPHVERIHIQSVRLGTRFSLEEKLASWSEPMKEEEARGEDPRALRAEYEDLARRAGIIV